jgi:hypothetical protein
MALLAPVVPSVALKQTVLSAALSRSGELAAAAGGAGAAGATAAGVTGTAATGLTAKALTVAALAIGTGGAGAIAVREVDPPAPPTPAAKSAAPYTAPGSATGPAAGSPAAKAGSPVLAPPRAEHGAAPGRSAIAPGRTKAKAHGRPADPHTAGQDRRAQGHGTLRPKRTGPPPQAAKPATPPRSSRAQPQKAPAARVKPVAPKLPPVKARAIERPAVTPPAATLPKAEPVKPPAATVPQASTKARGPKA